MCYNRLCVSVKNSKKINYILCFHYITFFVFMRIDEWYLQSESHIGAMFCTMKLTASLPTALVSKLNIRVGYIMVALHLFENICLY